MASSNTDTPSRYVHTLWTQPAKAEPRPVGALSCPYTGHHGGVLQNLDQPLEHATVDHAEGFENLKWPQARAKVTSAVRGSRRSEPLSESPTSRTTTPDMTKLSLQSAKETQTSPPPNRKRRADNELQDFRGKVPSHKEIVDSERPMNFSISSKAGKTRAKHYNARVLDHKQSAKNSQAVAHSTPQHSSGRSADATEHHQSRSISPIGKPQSTILQHSREPIALHKYDIRFPGLLLQPDSRPISQEQLASEVKSIYAGLTMVETKCIHVDRAQAAVVGDGNQDLAPDHWQALIALHRTLLHEHHDFFLASQHPSASPALRRLAGKYTMPARMWKHGIHSFLELLRQNLPYSLDYMLAFIYLAYQMMALLYETVPAFEDTWIECLGDLGRYRMAIEDEDIRDRETWAGVARNWYSKAADKNPIVGRLYHHLAILARPNALQQVYYYTTSLNCVEPFPSARESIMTLFRPFVADDQPIYTAGLPIDTNFTKSHALLFTKLAKPGYDQASQDFLRSLDNHIGRVTAKWREQGVYIAVSNLTAWFDYGVDCHILRQLFLLRASQRTDTSPWNERQVPVGPVDRPKPIDPKITEDQVPSQLSNLENDPTFARARSLTNDTFALALRREGDKNVLPHVHVMISFLTTLASVPCVSHLVDDTPWTELTSFLNTLIKTENQKTANFDINTLLSQPVFPGEDEKNERDDMPLPEDYLIRGLIWAQEYLPKNWLRRERDEEERYLELASTAKIRTERVLRLGYSLSTIGRWISYNRDTHTFAVINA